MHNYIMKDKNIDHIYHNKLDNRKTQLRISDDSNQNHNKPKLEGCTTNLYGISIKNENYKSIVTKGEIKYTRTFKSIIDATKYYNLAATILYGKFAKLNDINKVIEEYKEKEEDLGDIGIRQTPSGKWNARITTNKKEMSLGTFETKEEARKAYKDAINKKEKKEIDNIFKELETIIETQKSLNNS